MNTNTGRLSASLTAWKWIETSDSNFLEFDEPHDKHATGSPKETWFSTPTFGRNVAISVHSNSSGFLHSQHVADRLNVVSPDELTYGLACLVVVSRNRSTLLGACSGESWDVPLCDPACRRTTTRAVPDLPPVDHPAHTSTTVRFWSSPTPVPGPEPACHPHATSPRSARAVATLPPAVSVIDCSHPPSPPASSDPAPPLRGHRFLIAGTTAVLRNQHMR